MSTWWRPASDIPFAQLSDGRLEKYGIRIVDTPHDGKLFLVVRDDFLELERQKNGDCNFKRRGYVLSPINRALTEEFEIEWVSEHDHRFWGFATEEEWYAFNEKLTKEDEDRFYNDLLHYLRHEPNDLSPGTIGMIKAKIAKTLVASDPSLTAPEKRNALLEAVSAIYDPDDAKTTTLTERDLAPVELMAARTDDLPKA